MTKEEKELFKQKNSKYWKKRFSALENAQNQYGQQTYHQIESSFYKAQRQIQSQIETWYQRYADNNGITLAEARKQLTASELKELKWDVNEYIKYGKENALNQEWMKELENASSKYHISRLESLQLRTQQALEVAYGNELDSVDGMMKELYQSGYYHTCFELQKGFGIGWKIGQIDERKLEKILSRPWASDGKNFSDRIWQSKTTMVNELYQQMTRTIIQGKAPDQAIKELSRFVADKTKNAKYQAGRLVMTEQAYISSAAQKDAYNDLDVEEFEIVATLDSHTSEICQEMDGQHFPMKDFQPGVTAPPFHVWCRSTTVPYFDDEWGRSGERAARGEDGKTYYVPSDMTYPEWKKEYVLSTDEVAKDRFGFFSNNNKKNPHYYDATNKSIFEVENDLRNRDYETAVIFDDSGKAVSVQLGDIDSVSFTNHQLKLMKNADVTHNHPLGTTPSPEDLYLLKDYKAKSFRTCGVNGTYVLKYSKEVEMLPDFDELSKFYDEVDSEILKTHSEWINSSTFDPYEEIKVRGEEIWKRIEEKYSIHLYHGE